MNTFLKIWKSKKEDIYESKMEVNVHITPASNALFHIMSICKEDESKTVTLSLSDEDIDQLNIAINKYSKLKNKEIK